MFILIVVGFFFSTFVVIYRWR